MATNLLANQVRLGTNRNLLRTTVAVVCVVIALLVAKYFLFDEQRYLVPNHAVAPGEPLANVSWHSVAANLGSLGGSYLNAAGKPSGYAIASLASGQLVPKDSISPLEPGSLARVVVTTKTQLGHSIRTGAKVAVWSAPKLANNQFDAPKKIVANAIVARVLKQQAMFSAQSQQVELMISPIQTPVVLSAMASDSAIFLVADQ